MFDHQLHRRLRCGLTLIILIATCATFTSCFILPPPDDEGHASFARHSIPVLLGRRARGVDEVEAVADISELLGRRVAVRMMMNETEFVDHWTDVLIDLLEMQRDREGGAGMAQDRTCWGSPTRADPDPSIAQWVRDRGPQDTGAPTPPWNMTDLVRSAIAIDDLSPIYRAYLFPLSMRRAESFNNDRRAELTERLLSVYLNRDIACLRCHNPTFSTSNKIDNHGNVVWRRLWTLPGHHEKALFGNYYNAVGATERIHPILRGDVRQPDPDENNPGIQPWGMDLSCATDITWTSGQGYVPTHRGFRNLDSPEDEPFDEAGFGSLDGQANNRLSVWELEGALRQGIFGLRDGYQRFTSSSPLLPPEQQAYCDVVEVFSGNCTACHGATNPQAGLDLSTDPASALVNVQKTSGNSFHTYRVVPGEPDMSELVRRVEANPVTEFGFHMPPPPPMPPQSLSTEDQEAIRYWVQEGAVSIDTDNCNTSPIPDVDPNEALAYLTAANLVDGIWMAVMGQRLTIDHGYPRNSEQRALLWHLTEFEFLPKRWSLKGVLAKILSYDWFARRAPVISQRANAYQLPPVIDPWVEADPTVVTNPPPHQRANGQGELVHRYRVNTFLRSLAGALAWEKPKRFPNQSGAFLTPLDVEFGQYLSPGKPGFHDVSFQSLLALEARTRQCARSVGLPAGTPVRHDWLDKLAAEIVSYNAANSSNPITLGEAWSILKDRLIQTTVIADVLPSGLTTASNAKTETQALAAFLNHRLAPNTGGLDLSSSTATFSQFQLLQTLRVGCGVLIKTPQFILANVTPPGYSDTNFPAPPRLAVCMPDEPCGYDGICESWRGALGDMGHAITCGNRSVNHAPMAKFHRPSLQLAESDVLQPGPFTPRPSGLARPLWDRSAAPALETKRLLAAPGKPSAHTQLSQVRQRLASLCPKGVCGFLARPHIDECLQNPSTAACRALIPVCDPRLANAVDYCGDLPSDIRDSGVLATWAEDVVVTQAEALRILRPNAKQWESLQAGTELQAGDLVYVPLHASIQLQAGRAAWGARAMLKGSTIEGIKGHMIAITGKSAEKLLDQPTHKGALRTSELRERIESGEFESRGVTEADLKRIIGYGGRPESQRTPTMEEVKQINADFRSLHYTAESGMTPDGSPLREEPGTDVKQLIEQIEQHLEQLKQHLKPSQ